MEQYIDKSALVAEMEKRKNILKKAVWDLRTQENQENKDYYQGKAVAYKEAIDLLNTFEVKEVDLYEEADNYWGTLASDVRNSIYLNDFYKIAKHFFELGIKVAQKGKEV